MQQNIMNTLQMIISWANANSGFVSLLGFLLGSGIITSVLLQYPGIRAEKERIRGTKDKFKRILGWCLLKLKQIGIIAAKLFLIAVVLFFICFLALKKPDETQILDNGYNRVMLNSTQALEKRVLPPKDTLFPDVDMRADELMRRDKSQWEAVSAPFASDDPRQMLVELERDILKNPLMGDMVLRGVRQTWRSGIYGPMDDTWVEEFYREMSAAYERSGSGAGLYRWLKQYTFADGSKAIYVTDEYRFLGEQLCKYLEQYDIVGLMPVKAGIQYQRNHTLSYERLRAIPMECDAVMDALVMRVDAQTTEAYDYMAFAVSDKRLLLNEPVGRG